MNINVTQDATIKDKICEILTSKEKMGLNLDLSNVNDDTSFIGDLGLDSIQILELIVNIEEKFKVCINTEEISLDIFNKFSDLVKYINDQSK